MNFLAHLYLAGDDEEAIVGQMMADFLERGWRDHCTPAVQAAVAWHQRIDRYTDTHPRVAALRRMCREPYRRYAGIILDVLFDYSLARDWSSYSPHVDLRSFAESRYAVLERHSRQLTESLRRAIPYMKRYDWLSSYARRDGIESTLRGLSRRLKRENPLATSGILIDEIGPEIDAVFHPFFEDLIQAHAAPSVLAARP